MNVPATACDTGHSKPSGDVQVRCIASGNGECVQHIGDAAPVVGDRRVDAMFSLATVRRGQQVRRPVHEMVDQLLNGPLRARSGESELIGPHGIGHRDRPIGGGAVQGDRVERGIIIQHSLNLETAELTVKRPRNIAVHGTRGCHRRDPD